MTNSIYKHLRLKIPITHDNEFQPQIIIDCINQTKSEYRINIV